MLVFCQDSIIFNILHILYIHFFFPLGADKADKSVLAALMVLFLLLACMPGVADISYEKESHDLKLDI